MSQKENIVTRIAQYRAATSMKMTVSSIIVTVDLISIDHDQIDKLMKKQFLHLLSKQLYTYQYIYI